MYKTKLLRFPEFDCELVVEVTNQCHNRCEYCFYDFSKPKRELSPSRLEKFLELLYQITTKRRLLIYFQGAEALLAPTQLWEGYAAVIQRYLDRGFTLDCHLQTSLHGLETQLKQVIQAFPYFSTCSTSIDVSRTYINVVELRARLRQLREILSESDSEISFAESAIITLSLSNQHQISENLMLLTEELQIKKIRFRELVCNPETQSPEVFPDLNQSITIYDEIFSCSDQLLYFQVIEPFRSMAAFLLGYQPMGTCMLTPGCSNLFSISENLIGCCDISLELAGEHVAFASWGSTDFFNFVETVSTWRSRLPENCMSCEYLKGCWGGCPLRAQLTHGTINAQDSFCEVIQHIYQRLQQEQHSNTALWKSLVASVYQTNFLRLPTDTFPIL